MNNTLNNVIIFTAGAIIGSAVTWKLLETKHEQRLEEELESYKEARSKRERVSEISEERDIIPEEDLGISRAEYEELVQSSGYATQSEIEEQDVDNVEKPYVISPDEFAEFEDYETVSLTYYEDGILTDDNNEMVDDIAGTVGKDFVRHFGDYEDDAVHIRNDGKKCDYEILRDSRNYSDVRPHHTEV